jgi:hypothetical protein
MDLKFENIKPNIGAIVRADRESLGDEAFARDCLQLLAFFWHMDGLTSNIARPKATVLSARQTTRTRAVSWIALQLPAPSHDRLALPLAP